MARWSQRCVLPVSWACFSSIALLAQTPRIDSITPAQGPIAGGTEVVVRGANFGAAQLSLDNVKVAASSQTAGEVRFVTPQHDNGYAVLRIGTATTRFLYIPPALKDLLPGYITTIAGVGRYYGEYGPASEASVDGGGMAYGPDGSLYITQAGRNLVYRIRPDGILEPFAGKGILPPTSAVAGDGGPALEALIAFPRTVAVEDNGDVTIDGDGHRLWRVQAATGIIRVIAGTGEPGFSGDGGPAVNAKLNGSSHLATDGKGTLWFTDFGNARIRRITPDGKIDTICGTGTLGYSGDGGPALQAQINTYFNDYGDLAYDPGGFLYIADVANHRIRRINLGTGIIETFAGPERNFGANLFNGFGSFAIGPGGDVYFWATSQIFHVTRDGQLVERFGVVIDAGGRTGGPPTFADGTPLAKVIVGGALGLVLDAQGNIVYAATVSRVLRLNRAKGVLETIAGVGPGVLGEDGPALAASPIEPANVSPDLTVLPNGEVLFGGRRLRKIGLDGRLSVVAGNGLNSTSQEGALAIESGVQFLGFDFDAKGNLYFSTYSKILRIDPQGILHTFAGRISLDPNDCNPSGDGGPAIDAPLCQPHDTFADRDGNVFIADTNNNRIRRVDVKSGIITTVAGSGPGNGFEKFGKGTSCGDGGPATQACLNTPFSVGVNSQGEIYIIEGGGLRKVDRNGIISTVGSKFGLAIGAFMAFDATDNLYVTTSGVTRITPSGSSQLLACKNLMGFGGDGGPASAAVCNPAGGGTGFDADGNLYFVDGENRRIRAVRYGAVLAPPNAKAEIRGGTPQSSPLATAFATHLMVAVLDSAGQPATNVRVDFDAPVTGASCQQPHAFAISDRNGLAKITCTANTTPGTFAVTATPMGTAIGLKFSLTNTPPRLVSNSIVNAASFLNGPVAPGEIVTLFGAGIGPPALLIGAASGGVFDTQLGGTRVRFNGLSASVLYARSDQAAVVVPYGVANASSAQVEVEFAGINSNIVSVPVEQSSPGIFSSDSSGHGQGAILNEDGSYNSAARPAARGAILVFFATGEGITDPPSADGKLAVEPYPKPHLPVAVTIGGETAEIIYAGSAPGLVAGVLQVNARIPAAAASGMAIPVVLIVGGLRSRPDITAAIQ